MNPSNLDGKNLDIWFLPYNSPFFIHFDIKTNNPYFDCFIISAVCSPILFEVLFEKVLAE